MNHNAIRKAYPEVLTIDDGLGCFDANGNLVEIDELKVKSAAVILDKEKIAQAEAKATARAAAEAKLAALGLTADDLKALGL
jgi:hypothetical protein